MPHRPHSDERHVDVDGTPALLAGPHPLTMVYGGRYPLADLVAASSAQPGTRPTPGGS